MVDRGGATRSGGAEFSLGLDDTSVLERGLTRPDRPRADFERPLPAPPPTLSLARVQEYARNMRRLTPPQFRGAEVRVVYAPRSKPEMSEYGISSAAAARIGDQRPGPSLAEALEELQLAAADDATVVEAIAAYERLASWAVVEQARAVRELADRRGSSSVAQASTSNEIAARLGITGRAAENKVGFALALTSYPEVADALEGGQIDARKADTLATTEPGLSVREQRRLQVQVLPDAHRLTVSQLKARLRRAAITTDPDAGVKRRAKAFADRRVHVDPAGDAMAWVSALVRADRAEVARTVLDALARAARTEGDDRTLDQRRADAFADLFTAVLDRGVDLDGSPLPMRHGQRPHIQVTVGAGTLLGLDDEPAILGGHGPIPAELAREIAQDGTWRGLFTDAVGDFLALGSKKYVPGADLSRQVVARDVTCTFPGCRQPALSGDLDHIASYDPSAADVLDQTTTVRLQALCRRHHNLKTAKLWDATRDENGQIVWVAPTGHQYARPPDRPPPGAVRPG